MKAIYLRGVGLWTPGFPNPGAWLRGEADPDVTTPEARILEGPLRRRASPLTKISVEVFDQVVRGSGADPKTVQTIWATAHGEHGTAIKLLKMMLRGEGKLSPTHFHNSVHNTSSAYTSIAHGNAAGSTTLTGGPELVSSAILEAFCHLDQGATEVVVVVGDEPLHEPFHRSDMQAPLALSFCFGREAEGAVARLSDFRRNELPSTKLHDRLGGLYVSAGLQLLEQAVAQKPGTVALELAEHRKRSGHGDERGWCVEIEPLVAS